MNVAYTPSAIATSFTTCRNVMTLSAVVSASAYRRSISCWPGATSWWLNSTEMPSASSIVHGHPAEVVRDVVAGQVEVAAGVDRAAAPARRSGWSLSRKNSISGWV